MDNMEIFCVHWNNYHLHEDVMKMTRLYRHDHLWCVETDRNLSEEYLESDKTKITFVSTKDNEFVGMIDFINYSMDTVTHTHIPDTCMAQFDPSLARLRQVIVDPRFRGSGVGSLLVEKVKEEARKQNKKELFVNAWVASKGFYSRLGFTEVGSAYESGEGAKKIYCQRMVLALTQ